MLLFFSNAKTKTDSYFAAVEVCVRMQRNYIQRLHLCQYLYNHVTYPTSLYIWYVKRRNHWHNTKNNLLSIVFCEHVFLSADQSASCNSFFDLHVFYTYICFLMDKVVLRS